MNSITFAFISFFTWGIGITFEAIAARKIDSFSFCFWGELIGFALSSLYIPFAVPQLSHITLPLILLCLLIGVLIFIGSVCYYEALKKGNPSLVGTIGSAFPFITVILSVIFLKERLTTLQVAVIAFILIGLVLSMLDISGIKKRKIVFNSGVLLAIATMLLWGAYGMLIKIPISQIGWFWPNWLGLSIFPIVFLYMRMTGRSLQIPKKSSIIFPVFLAVIFVRVAEYAYNLGLSKGNASIVAPIAGANPILFVVLAYFIFKEPLKKSQIIGIAATLIGIVLLSAITT